MNAVISDVTNGVCGAVEGCMGTATTPLISQYKREYTLESRRAKHERKRRENPGATIVVLDPHGGVPFENGRPYMKFVVREEFTYAQLIMTIRRYISVSPEQAVFVLLEKGILPCPTQTLSRVYAEHGDPDGALYARVTTENTFGRCAGDGAFENCFMWASTCGSLGLLFGVLGGYTYTRCLTRYTPDNKERCTGHAALEADPPPPYAGHAPTTAVSAETSE